MVGGQQGHSDSWDGLWFIALIDMLFVAARTGQNSVECKVEKSCSIMDERHLSIEVQTACLHETETRFHSAIVLQ